MRKKKTFAFNAKGDAENQYSTDNSVKLVCQSDIWNKQTAMGKSSGKIKWENPVGKSGIKSI